MQHGGWLMGKQSEGNETKAMFKEKDLDAQSDNLKKVLNILQTETCRRE